MLFSFSLFLSLHVCFETASLVLMSKHGALRRRARVHGGLHTKNFVLFFFKRGPGTDGCVAGMGTCTLRL